MNNKNTFVLLILLFVVISLLAVAVIDENRLKDNYISNEVEIRNDQIIEYSTINAEFSVRVPSDYRVEKDITYLKLINSDGKELVINWIASEYYSLAEHLENLERLNKLRIEFEVDIVTEDTIETAYTRIYNQDGETLSSYTYFVFNDGWVYAITARDEELFDDLRSVAESFELKE